MQNSINPFEYCENLIEEFERVIETPVLNSSKEYYTGVDLGTACVVLAVLDENMNPVAGAYRYADVVRDGMVVDYIGAVQIVRELKTQIEEQLGTELVLGAAAIPPGTDELDSGAIKNVVQAAGFELIALMDEPTAANNILKMKNGVVVDLGGGTTGLSILKDGKVVYVADEPTGGTHFSLVVSGAYRLPFDQAEKYKRNIDNHQELLPVLKPVIEKISSIINRHISGHDVSELALVGGTACLTGIEGIIEKETGIFTHKPANPMFVTPLGIAMGCAAAVEKEKLA
jgi:ethanolamine utilization protein EutJ